jgi:hypothetical protein
MKKVLVRHDDTIDIGWSRTLPPGEVTHVSDLPNHEIENRTGILMRLHPFLLRLYGTDLKSKDTIDDPYDNQGHENGHKEFNHGKAFFVARFHLSFVNSHSLLVCSAYLVCLVY